MRIRFENIRCVLRNTFLRLTLDLGVASDQCGNVLTRVQRYQGEWKPSVLADYRWALNCDFPQAKYSRKLTEVTFKVSTEVMLLCGSSHVITV